MISNIQIAGTPDTHPERRIPDAHELASGQIDLSKLRIAKHVSKVFDLMDDGQRKEYDDLYVELSDLSKQGKIFISSNSREVLVRPDGSTGWFKYLEWSEFDTTGILGA